MSRRLVSIFLSLCVLVCSVVCLTACGESKGLDYVLINNDTEYAVVHIGDCDDEKIVIPSEYKGKPVTQISKSAFSECEDIRSVKIPNTITSIGDYAFNECESLKSVTFEEGSKLQSIGECAFKGCKVLTSIEIPDSVTSVGMHAFLSCDNMQYNIENGFKYLGNSSNKYMLLVESESKEIESININSNCKIIGATAFFACRKLTSVELPEGVISIGYKSFASCDLLTTVKFPKSVRIIDSFVFGYYCKNLTAITFAENSQLEKICEYAFSGCNSLTIINYNNTVSKWNEVEKEKNWNGDIEKVICTDSVVYLT